MKKFLCILIFSTFFGSSFTLFTVGPISFYAFRVVFIVFTVTHILMQKSSIRYHFTRKYTNILLMFVMFTALSFIQIPDFFSGINGCIFWIINFCLIYYIYLYTDSEKDLNRYVYSFMLGLLMTMLISVYEYRTGNHLVSSNYLIPYSTLSSKYQSLSQYPTGFLYNPNNIGVAMLFGTGFGIMLLKSKKKRGILLCVAWITLSIYTAFATGSRGAIVFVLVSVALSLIILPSKGKNTSFYAALFFMGVALYTYFSDFIWIQLERSGLLTAKIGQSVDDVGRWDMIYKGLQAAADSVFLGTGPGTSEITISKFNGGMSFPIHNFWIELLVTVGIGGFICFLVFYIHCLRAQWKMRKKYAASGSILLALIIFSVACVIPPTVITLHFIWLIFGFSIATEKLYYMENNAQTLSGSNPAAASGMKGI